ncbi:dihydrodipicolinate synthase family protein [Microbacterium enclense]|uniref:dihydrodipicolinate synthase family protein n=1 Tax=Microbacterium enclense TaxID=993073 RepID=UPI003D7626E4
MSDFTGLIPPIVTPLTSDGDVDVDGLRNVIDFQLAAGANGIFVLGSSGEAIYLDDTERRQVALAARAAIDGRAPLLIGALAPTARRVAQQIALLGDARPDAVVVTAPFYSAPSQNEVAAHFRYAAAVATAPVLAYDIPGNVGTKIPTEVITTLLADGSVAGLKDSSGDVDTFARIAQDLGADRRGVLLSGADTAALKALDAGADGLIPGLANIRPDIFVSLLDAHRARDSERADQLQVALITLNQVFKVGVGFGLGRHASEIGALKHVLNRLGVLPNPASPLPLETFPAAAGEVVDQILETVDRQLAGDVTLVRSPGDTNA